MTVAGGAVRFIAGITCDSRTSGAGLNTGVGSEFLGMRTGLASTVPRPGVLTSVSVLVENSSVRSYLASAAARLAFFKAVFEGVSLILLDRDIFSIFLSFKWFFFTTYINKDQYCIKSICLVCRQAHKTSSITC